MAKAKKKKTTEIRIPARNAVRLRVRIEGRTPLMQNRWRDTVVEQMREKQEGKAKAKKVARDPDAEVAEILASATISENGTKQYGHPKVAIVESVASAAHRLGEGWKNKGPTIKGAVTILTPHDLVPLEAPEPERDTRPGRIKGTWTIAHRPKYWPWAMEFEVEVDQGVMSVEEFLHLLVLAGTGVGIGSYRVERSGTYGTFDVVGAEVMEG